MANLKCHGCRKEDAVYDLLCDTCYETAKPRLTPDPDTLPTVEGSVCYSDDEEPF